MFSLPKQEPPVFAKPKGDERNRIVKMRTALVMREPFWGILAARLKLIEDAPIGTMGTDGKVLRYNPAYIAGMSDKKLMGLLVHEVQHIVFEHSFRRGNREPHLWNIACDYAIDYLATKYGFDVPNPLINPEWAGWLSEQIYDVLKQERDKQQPKPDKQPSSGEGEGEGEGEGKQPSLGGNGEQASGNGERQPTKGEVLDSPKEESLQLQAEWKQAISSAAEAARMQGNLPAHLQELVTEVLAPRVDWKAVLRRFVQMCARNDYTWRTPSPRYMPMGLYMPRLQSEQTPPIVVAVDTSSSIRGRDLAQFAGEIASIIDEARPECTHLVYCDAQVQATQEYMPGDPIEFTPKGRGGTSFVPVFEWVSEQGLDPACLIYLTDMYGDAPDEEPGYPVLWASTTKNVPDHYTPKFGEVVFLDFEE